MSRYVSDSVEVEGEASEDEPEDEDEDDDTASQHRNQGLEDEEMESENGEVGEIELEGGNQSTDVRGVAPATNAQRRAEHIASIEGVTSEVAKYLIPLARSQMIWRPDIDRYTQTDIPEEWDAWGRVPDASDGHIKLREAWLSWMACTSKLLQTVDNKHLNRHVDYLYSGPTINFVDLQTTPQIGRRLQILAHLIECINNFGEFPMDCVVPTKETEIVFGSGRANGKLVRGMRMKNSDKKVSREVELVSAQPARAAERWLKNFNRG